MAFFFFFYLFHTKSFYSCASGIFHLWETLGAFIVLTPVQDLVPALFCARRIIRRVLTRCRYTLFQYGGDLPAGDLPAGDLPA